MHAMCELLLCDRTEAVIHRIYYVPRRTDVHHDSTWQDNRILHHLLAYRIHEFWNLVFDQRLKQNIENCIWIVVIHTRCWGILRFFTLWIFVTFVYLNWFILFLSKILNVLIPIFIDNVFLVTVIRSCNSSWKSSNPSLKLSATIFLFSSNKFLDSVYRYSFFNQLWNGLLLNLFEKF